MQKARQNRTDAHSRYGDPQFQRPQKGDYRVSKGSLALAVGFQNFPMNQFGVQKPALRALARSPKLPALLNSQQEKNVTEMTWLGIMIRNVQGPGDRSAFGLPDEHGIIVLTVPKESKLATSGMQKGDVIRTANGTNVTTIRQLIDLQQQLHYMKALSVKVMRNQQLVELNLPMR